MKPEYRILIDNGKSAFDAAKTMDEILQQIKKAVESYPKIVKSTLPFYVTVIVNPREERLVNANNLGNGFYTLLSPEVESDTTIFALQARLATLSLAADKKDCLVVMSTQASFRCDSNESNKKNSNEDETPDFIPLKPTRTFDDIILSDDVKSKILRALSIIKNKQLIFETWGFNKIDKSTKSILCFFGPAGTGKTMTAEAIGSYLGKNIIHSSYAEIESQWVGVGAKNLHAIFKAASDNDAILFFDEADSFLSNRISHTSSSSDKHYNRMSNELFQLLENFDGCVIFATNLLTDIDEAFKSRIIDSIKFELPNKDERIKLVKLMLPKKFPLLIPLTEENYNELSLLTEGFSGRDLRKSVLLSLASAAEKYSETIVYDFDDIKVGFLQVKQSKENMQKELDVIEECMLGENLLEHQILNEKIVSMAKLACLSDGVIDDRERLMIKDLSRSLLGVENIDISLTTDETISNVCKGLKDNIQKTQLLDVAIKLIAVDNQIQEREIIFLKTVMAELMVKPDKVESIINYTKQVADCCNEFEQISLNLFVDDK